MNILVYEWDIYPYNDIINTLKKQGHQVDVLAFPIINHISDSAFTAAFLNRLSNKKYDIIFSINYFAVIGTTCAKINLPYISWTCDTPLLSMQHPSVYAETNFIFTFDKKEANLLKQKGVPHIYYLPLAGKILTPEFYSTKKSFLYDISFVGNLYDKNRYDEICYFLPPYLCGYMDSAIEAQKMIHGGNILPLMLNDSILSDLSSHTKIIHSSNSSLEELRIHFATSILSYKVASDVRKNSLNYLAQNFKVDLFTTSNTDSLLNVTVHPPVDYHTKMPETFAKSKINLNITIPNIENGIPLRVFDILSSGGFLLTDYRPALCEEFKNETDLVIYEGLQDLKEKAFYYMTHDEERMRIAAHGQQTILKHHQYSQKLHYILDTVCAVIYN